MLYPDRIAGIITESYRGGGGFFCSCEIHEKTETLHKNSRRRKASKKMLKKIECFPISCRLPERLDMPLDVDKYINDHERIIELSKEKQSSEKSAFITRDRSKVVHGHIKLWKGIKDIRD